MILQTSAPQDTSAMKPATLVYILPVKTTLTASWDRVTPSTGSITPPALFALMESASQGARATRAVRLDTSVMRTVTNVRQLLGKGCSARSTFGHQCLVQSAAQRVEGCTAEQRRAADFVGHLADPGQPVGGAAATRH